MNSEICLWGRPLMTSLVFPGIILIWWEMTQRKLSFSNFCWGYSPFSIKFNFLKLTHVGFPLFFFPPNKGNFLTEFHHHYTSCGRIMFYYYQIKILKYVGSITNSKISCWIFSVGFGGVHCPNRAYTGLLQTLLRGGQGWQILNLW